MKLNLQNTQAARLKLKNLAAAEMWRRGEFAPLLLKGPQLEMVAAFDNYKDNQFFFLCSRRLGKTVTLFTIAVRECLRTPASKVLYLSMTTDQIREIVAQAEEVVFENCPDDLKPKWKSKEGKFVFPNGSEIRVKGLDKAKGSSIRGVGAKLVIFDEACFMDDLAGIVKSVVMPMVNASKGRVLYGSTPPDSPGHDSIAIISECEAAGGLIVKDIYSMRGILYDDQQIKNFERDAGGADTTVFKREYLAQVVVETDMAIVPAATKENLEKIVKEIEMPKGYWPDCYVGLDIGTRDLTVALFGYWDFENARLVIQDEMVLADKSVTTENIALGIQATEKKLWGARPPYKRFSDNEPLLLRDLKRLHDLDLRVTAKDNKEAQVNQLNIMVNNGSIVINPSCKTLISHLKYGVWNKTRSEFARSKTLGHSDAIDALIYLLRNVKRNRNPVPADFHHPGSFVNHGGSLNPTRTGGVDELAKAFK